MSKIVISGSAKLQNQIKYWINHFKSKGYKVIDYPKPLDPKRLIELYPDTFKTFYKSITEADTLFVMNKDRKEIEGYIGAGVFAEMAHALNQKLNKNQKINIILYKKPSPEVFCYDEITLWLKLGWISLYE